MLTTDLGTLYRGDCLELMAALDGQSVDLWFADPPFNLAKDYGDGVTDQMGTEEYLAWMRAWLLEGVRLLKPGGSLFVFHLPRWNVEAGHTLNQAGLLFRHWIAIDITYEPRMSAWRALHERSGCPSANGLGMLAYQAALQMQWWWERPIDGARLLEVIA